MSKMKDAWYDEFWEEIDRNGNNRTGSKPNRKAGDALHTSGNKPKPYTISSYLPTSEELAVRTENFYLDVMTTSDEALNILIKKHEDYGPENIARAPGGAINGLAVRLHDKVARLSNLLQTGRTANYESLRDTFIDISNYGLIGLMVLDGKWDGVDKKDTQ